MAADLLEVSEPLQNEPTRDPVTFDEGYLARLRNGDDDTAKHFDRHFRRLLRRWLWYRFSGERTQDLIDDVMTAALKSILRGEPKHATHLPAYIRGICSNLTKKEMRPRPDHHGVDLNIERISDPGKTIEQSLLEQERAKAVREVLNTLSSRDRNLLTELFYNELGRDEICDKYGVTREQLRLSLYHARRRFQKKWLREFSHGSCADLKRNVQLLHWDSNAPIH
jgi:RNA polymerase sigma-70 factor, ECF subfamily